jgi:hypothetical protein
MPDLTQKDLRHTNLHGLQAVVQYMGVDSRPDVSPTTWRTMAAFDSMSMAEQYAAGCKSEIWQYRAIELAAE